MSRSVRVDLLTSMYFQWNGKCFFFCHMELYSWFSVMTINEVPLNRPKIATGFSVICWFCQFLTEVSPGAMLPWSPLKIEPKPTQALSVSPHPGPNGLVQDERAAPSPEFWPFSPAFSCYLGALPEKVKTIVPVPPGDHLPLRAARSSLLCVSLEVLTTPTRRYHGRTCCLALLRQHVPPTMQKFLHTRRFGTLAGSPPPVVDPFWGPRPPGGPQHSDLRFGCAHKNFSPEVKLPTLKFHRVRKFSNIPFRKRNSRIIRHTTVRKSAYPTIPFSFSLLAVSEISGLTSWDEDAKFFELLKIVEGCPSWAGGRSQTFPRRLVHIFCVFAAIQNRKRGKVLEFRIVEVWSGTWVAPELLPHSGSWNSLASDK